MPRLPRPTPSCLLEYGHDHWCSSSDLGPRVTLRTTATNKKVEQKESRCQQHHTSLGLMTSTFHLRNKLSWLSWLLCVLCYMQPKPARAPLATFRTTSHANRIPSKRQFAAKGNSSHTFIRETRKPPLRNDVPAEDQRGWAAWGGDPELRPHHVITPPATKWGQRQLAGHRAQSGKSIPCGEARLWLFL